MSTAEHYDAFPAKLRDDLEATFLGKPYDTALYKWTIGAILLYATRSTPAAFVLHLFAPGSPDANPLLATVQAVESVPLLHWPNLVRHCYAKTNLVEATSLKLMLPDREFVLGFQLIIALYMKTRKAHEAPPSEGVFAHDAADTVEAATEADLDFTC